MRSRGIDKNYVVRVVRPIQASNDSLDPIYQAYFYQLNCTDMINSKPNHFCGVFRMLYSFNKSRTFFLCSNRSFPLKKIESRKLRMGRKKRALSWSINRKISTANGIEGLFNLHKQLKVERKTIHFLGIINLWLLLHQSSWQLIIITSLDSDEAKKKSYKNNESRKMLMDFFFLRSETGAQNMQIDLLEGNKKPFFSVTEEGLEVSGATRV